MSLIAVAVGPALVGLAFLLVARQKGTRGEPSGLILASAPLAFLSITIPLFLGTGRFVAGFHDLARQGRRGAPVVAPLCLGIARPLLFGPIAALVSLGAAAALQVFLRRALSPQSSVERQAFSSWFGTVLLVASSSLALPVGALFYTAQRLASLTMLAVDPAKKEEAKVRLAGISVQQISGMIASRSTAILYGSLTLSTVLLAFGIAGVLTMRSNRRRQALGGYSWLFLLVVTLAAAWGIFRLQSDVSGYAIAMRGSPPPGVSGSPMEKTTEKPSTP